MKEDAATHSDGLVRLSAVALSFTAYGLLDGIFAALSDGSLDAVAALSTSLVTVGLWVVLACACWLGLSLAILGPGASSLERALVKLRDSVATFEAEADPTRDRERLATLLGWVTGLALWFLLGAAALAYLIATRHGPWLISIASLTAHLLLVPAATLAGASSRRLCLSLMEALAKREPFSELLRFKTLLRVLKTGWVLATGLAVAVMLAAELTSMDNAALRLFHAVDGTAFLLPLLALGSLPFAHRRLRGPQGLISSAMILVFGLAVGFLGLQVESARIAVATNAPTSKYMLQRLQKMSDGDGDGVAAAPFGADCGPDDPTIKPFAPDPPGDGIDQDCDGSDGIAVALDSPGTRLPDATPLERKGEKPNLVLITIDALRADHLGAYGYNRPVSPVFDTYAARGVLFNEAFSQDSGTGPSLWSLMVGKTPFQVKLERAERFPPRYADTETTLATRLKGAGYQTAAVLCGQVFGTPWWNLKDGFDTFSELCGAQDKHQAAKVTREALKTWRDLSAKGPTSMWVHYYDPHSPYYNSPIADFGSETVDRYDEEIAFTDKHLAPLLEALTIPGARPTYIVITADHGEGFGEHGADPHARTLYREVTRVPLLFLGPDLKPRTVQESVGVHDIAPTWLDLAGLPIPEEMTARSLGRVLLGEPAPSQRLVFQENSYSRPRRDAKGVIRGPYHFILDVTNGASELYDMEADPLEKNNLVGRGLPAEHELRSAIRAFLPSTHVPAQLSK
jgi:choline-sulfatase